MASAITLMSAAAGRPTLLSEGQTSIRYLPNHCCFEVIPSHPHNQVTAKGEHMSGNFSGDFSPLQQPTTVHHLVNVLLAQGLTPQVIRYFPPDSRNDGFPHPCRQPNGSNTEITSPANFSGITLSLCVYVCRHKSNDYECTQPSITLELQSFT